STWLQKVGSRARKTSCSFTPEGPLAYSPTLTSCRRFERTCERQIPRGRHAAGTESCRSPPRGRRVCLIALPIVARRTGSYSGRFHGAGTWPEQKAVGPRPAGDIYV